MELNDIEARKKIKTLEVVKTDPINWLTYYIDPDTSEKWVEDRPQSGYHGGGPPRLKLVDKFPWEEEKSEVHLTELDRLYSSAFNLQEKASEALWTILKEGTADPVKVRDFVSANESFHNAYDELVEALKKGGKEYSIVLKEALLEIDKPFIGFRKGLAIASTRTNTRIHRDLNDL